MIAAYHKFVHGSHGYVQQNEAACALRVAGKQNAARTAYGDTTAAPLSEYGEHYLKNIQAQINAGSANASRLAAMAKATGAEFAAAALVLGFAIAALRSRSTSRSLGVTTLAVNGIVPQDIAALTLILKRLAAGDLTGSFASKRVPLEVSGTDEIGALTTTYRMRRRYHDC